MIIPEIIPPLLPATGQQRPPPPPPPCKDTLSNGTCDALPSAPQGVATFLCANLGPSLCEKTCDNIVGGTCWVLIPCLLSDVMSYTNVGWNCYFIPNIALIKAVAVKVAVVFSAYGSLLAYTHKPKFIYIQQRSQEDWTCWIEVIF